MFFNDTNITGKEAFAIFIVNISGAIFKFGILYYLNVVALFICLNIVPSKESNAHKTSLIFFIHQIKMDTIIFNSDKEDHMLFQDQNDEENNNYEELANQTKIHPTLIGSQPTAKISNNNKNNNQHDIDDNEEDIDEDDDKSASNVSRSSCYSSESKKLDF